MNVYLGERASWQLEIFAPETVNIFILLDNASRHPPWREKFYRRERKME